MKKNAKGDAAKGARQMLVIQPGSMKLGAITNPLRDDYITVKDASGDPRDVTTAAPLASGDSVICEAEASGSIVATDAAGNPALIANFSGDDPANVEVDWSQVLSVDEYYNGSGQTYDLTVEGNLNNEVITIVG